MTRYVVELTDAALAAIAAHARYIANDAQAPLVAQRWLECVWNAVDSLEQWPRRASKAEEAALVGYEVRQLVIGKHLLLFMIDDARQRVWVIGFRHGHRLPRAQGLPEDPAGLGGDDEEGSTTADPPQR